MSTSHSDKFAADNLPPKETWPQFTEINYKGLLNCGAAILDGAIRRGWGSRTLFLSETGNITYGEFLKLTNKIAHVLVNDCKLVPGNRVLLRGANTPTLAAIWFAVVKAGGICVTTMPLLRAKELSYIIEKAQIGLCLCESTLLEEIKEVQKAPGTLKQVLSYGGQSGEIESAAKKYPDSFNNIDTDANDVALIAFTSGTTGKAKATMHFHRDVMAICDAFPISTLRA